MALRGLALLVSVEGLLICTLGLTRGARCLMGFLVGVLCIVFLSVVLFLVTHPWRSTLADHERGDW